MGLRLKKMNETLEVPGKEGDHREERKGLGYEKKDIFYVGVRGNYNHHSS